MAGAALTDATVELPAIAQSASASVDSDDSSVASSTATTNGKNTTSDFALAMYTVVSMLCLLTIVVHRRCPVKFKAIDLFADKHVIEDTHAVRLLETRIGAAFSLVMVFIVIALVVFILDPKNNVIESSGLKPAIETLLSDSDGFGEVQLAVIAIAPVAIADLDCGAIKMTPASGFSCSPAPPPSAATNPASISICPLAYICTASVGVRGQDDFLFELPYAFQWVRWSAKAEPWTVDPVFAPELLSGTLPADGNDDDDDAVATLAMAGTRVQPSTVQLGALRSRFRDQTQRDEKETRYGLQLFKLATNVQRAFTGAGAASGDVHFVALRVTVSENMYDVERTPKHDTASLVSQLFAYMLSALSVLAVLKKYTQMLTDQLLLLRAQQTKTKVPEDVKRRIKVLNEQILSEVRRRVSMVQKQNLFPSSGNEHQGIELANIALTKGAADKEGAVIPMMINPLARDNGRRSSSSAVQNMALGDGGTLGPTVAAAFRQEMVSLTAKLTQVVGLTAKLTQRIQELEGQVAKLDGRDGPGVPPRPAPAASVAAAEVATAQKRAVIVDEATGMEYYIDPDTGESFWVDDEA